MSSEFDQFADTYRSDMVRAISFCRSDPEFFTKVKADDLLATVAARLGPPRDMKLLDVGCGVGETDQFLIPNVRELHGVDVSADSIDRAAAAHPQGHYRSYDGQRLPFEDNVFDLAFAICVMHHVPPPQWVPLLAEMKRVVRPGGIVAVYEHNPWNPGTRRVVNTCAFDQDAILITRRQCRGLVRAAGMSVANSRDILFFPFGGRVFRGLERALGWFPMGAQYTVAGLVGPSA